MCLIAFDHSDKAQIKLVEPAYSEFKNLFQIDEVYELSGGFFSNNNQFPKTRSNYEVVF